MKNKALATLLASMFATTATAGVDLRQDEFTLTLAGDWMQVKSLDPEQFSFESKQKKTSVVLSVMTGMRIPQVRLVETAKKFAELRKQAEQKARVDRHIQWGDQWVELKPTGDVAEVAYAAFDPKGTVFRFFGFVTQRKVLSFWVATESRDGEFSKQVFDEVFRGLKFPVP
jgi:hypothetical protein